MSTKTSGSAFSLIVLQTLKHDMQRQIDDSISAQVMASSGSRQGEDNGTLNLQALQTIRQNEKIRFLRQFR